MNWKNITKDRLQDHRTKIAAQQNIKARVKDLNKRMQGAKISSMSTTPTEFDCSRYENNLLNTIAEKQELIDTYNRNAQDIKLVENAIDSLEGREKEIAKDLYITGLSLAAIAEKTTMDESTLYRIRGTILRKITLYLYGREMN